MTEKTKPIAPEWFVSRRDDAGLDERMNGGWGIRPAPMLRGAPYTDFSDRIMAVPLGESDAEQAVQLHEMIHAALSPADVPGELLDLMGISKQAVQLAEEVRVNFVGSFLPTYSQDLGGSTRNLADGSEMGATDRICATEAWNDALNLFLSTYNTEMFRKVKRRLRRVKHWREPLAQIEKYLDVHGYTKNTVGALRRLRQAQDTFPEIFRWVDRKNNERETILNSGFTTANLPLATVIDEWIANPPAPSVSGEKTKREVVPRADGWADLRIGSTRLTEPTTAFIGRRKRPAMTGKHPSRPDRLLTDPERRIFRETVKSNGGVVVFDCSGSMGVTHEVVRQAVKQFAGATVMVYSDSMRSDSSSRPNAWVVARNGRMISNEDFDELPLHSGNGVDGPALRWAIKNRKTDKDFVLWVSDGHVTGRGDHHTQELIDEVAMLSRRYGIVGVDDCEAAVELLRHMKTTGKVPRNRYCRVIENYIEEKNRRNKK